MKKEKINITMQNAFVELHKVNVDTIQELEEEQMYNSQLYSKDNFDISKTPLIKQDISPVSKNLINKNKNS